MALVAHQRSTTSRIWHWTGRHEWNRLLAVVAISSTVIGAGIQAAPPASGTPRQPPAVKHTKPVPVTAIVSHHHQLKPPTC